MNPSTDLRNRALPNISVDLLAELEIADIRDKFEEERVNYINAVTGVARNAASAFSAGDFEDVLRWAKNEAAFNIAPKARLYEIAVSQYKRKALESAGFSIWKDGVPAIGAAYLSGGILPALSVAGAQILQSLVHATLTGQNHTKIPEVAYGMKIRSEINSSQNK
jgi:hypothetical protein